MAVEYTPLRTFDGEEQEKESVETSSQTTSPPRRRRDARFYLIIAIFVLLLAILVLLLTSFQSSALQSWKEHFRDNDKPGFHVSEYANYEYWRERIPKPKSQDAEFYIDHIVDHGESTPSEVMDLSIAKQSKQRAVFVPTYPGHYQFALQKLRSLQCLCNDIQRFDVVVILSNSIEVEEFEEKVSRYLSMPCPAYFGRFEIKEADRQKPLLNMRYVNMFDTLPARLQNMDGVSPNNTQVILDVFGKYKYQGIKKLATTRYLSYSWVLWVDSEGVAVQPFSMNELFDKQMERPIIWRSRWGHENDNGVVARGAEILGRSLDSFGWEYFNGIESLQWIIERAVIEDMFHWVERAHRHSFWDIFLDGATIFEIMLYHIHIAARKLETGPESVFAKYRILEVERELIRFGLGPAMSKRRDCGNTGGGGLLGFTGCFLREPGAQPNLTAMHKFYNMQLVRLHDLNLVDRDVMERFLLEMPVAMLVSDEPGMHRWWNSTFEDPEPLEDGVERRLSKREVLGGWLGPRLRNFEPASR